MYIHTYRDKVVLILTNFKNLCHDFKIAISIYLVQRAFESIYAIHEFDIINFTHLFSVDTLLSMMYMCVCVHRCNR